MFDENRNFGKKNKIIVKKLTLPATTWVVKNRQVTKQYIKIMSKAGYRFLFLSRYFYYEEKKTCQRKHKMPNSRKVLRGFRICGLTLILNDAYTVSVTVCKIFHNKIFVKLFQAEKFAKKLSLAKKVFFNVFGLKKYSQP